MITEQQAVLLSSQEYYVRIKVEIKNTLSSMT